MVVDKYIVRTNIEVEKYEVHVVVERNAHIVLCRFVCLNSYFLDLKFDFFKLSLLKSVNTIFFPFHSSFFIHQRVELHPTDCQ